MVQQLATEVAVPPNAEIDGDAGGAVDDFAPRVADAAGGRGPHLQAGVRGVDVGSHAAAYIFVGENLEENLAGASIAEVAAVAFVLVAVPDAEGLSQAKHCQMHGIAMTEAGVVETAAVVVKGHGAIGDLVAAIAIDIADAQVVVALTGIAAPFGRVGVEGPTHGEVLAVEVVGRDACTGVVTATEDGAEVLAVEVGAGGQEAVAAVGVVVAPATQFATFGDIVNGAEGAAGEAIEAGDPLRTFIDEAATRSLAVHLAGPTWTAELLAGVAIGLVGYGVGMTDMVGCGVAEDGTCAVDGAVAGAHEEFGTAVTIEVGDDEGGVVGAAADVAAEVDAPHGSAIEAQGLKDGGRGDAALAVVATVGGVPLQDDLHLPIAIEVGHGGVVGVVERLSPLPLPIREGSKMCLSGRSLVRRG